MQKTLILCLFLAMYCFSQSQVLTVNDQETGRPLELVTLISSNPRAYAVTNSLGQVDISAFNGAEKIEIYLVGYRNEARSYAQLGHIGLTMVLSASEFPLNELVISASRWIQNKREIPSKISRISSSEVALQNPQTSADLLGCSGEVFIQKSQMGGGSPMIRGFSTNRLLIAVDGVRMNTAIFRSGNLQNVISLDPFAIENSEVLFGPGSVMYGSDAIGGVMSFQTLIPQLSFRDEPLVSGKAVSRYSSANNEKTIHFDVNTGWRKWSLLTSMSHNEFGDLRMGKNGPEEYLRPSFVQRLDSTDFVVTNSDPLIQRSTGYAQSNIMQKIRFRPNEKWDLQYGLHYSVTSDYSRYDRLIRLRGNGLPGSAEWYYGPQEWMMNSLSIVHKGNNRLYDRMGIRLAHQFFEESRIDRDFNDPQRRHRIEKVYAWSANIDLNKVIGKRQELFYGFEAVFDEVSSSGMDEDISTNIITPGPARYPQSTWASYAGYITWQYKISDRFLVQAGARYNQFLLKAEFDTTFYPFPYSSATLNKGALTGSLGFVFNPLQNWTLSINGSSGFRSPNVDDLGKVFDSGPGLVIIPNPALNAEYAYNVEASIGGIIRERLKVDVTGYCSLLDNALVRRDYTLNGEDSIVYNGELSRVQAVQNGAFAKVFGVTASLEIKLTSGFSLSSKYNYQQGREELEDHSTSPLRHVPPAFGSTHLLYSNRKIRLDFYTLYCAQKKYGQLPEEEKGKAWLYAIDDNGDPYSPSWFTLNFKAFCQVSENFSIGAGLENILDKRYRPYSSGIVSPGMNMILSARADF